MEIDVFISHHTDSSLHIVEAIVNKLENKGIRCWYAPRNTKGVYASNIVEAINSCKVFLLILNKPSSTSFDVLNEINIVANRLRKNEAVEVIPFHTADPDAEIDDSMQYYISRMHWIDAMTPPMYDRIDELVERIRLSIDPTNSHSCTKNMEEGSEYKLVSRIPEAREIFDGRDEVIEQIKSTFENGHKVIFLEGIGGIGKTELAKQYSIRYQKDYDTIVFARYTQDLLHLITDDNELKIEGLVKNDGENNEEYFIRKLNILKSITNERVLIIIDNFDVDDDSNLKEFLLGNYNVIITTRNQHSGYKTIKIGPINDEEKLFSIFERNYENSISEEDKEYIRKIFELIEYHTYAIELIAKQMEASFIEPKDMLKIMKDGALKDAVTEDISGRDSMKSAFSHITSLFNTGNLSDKDRNILMYLSIMGISGAPANKFKEWCKLENFNEINSLIRKSWIRKENSKISIHPLVREVIWEELKPDLENCHDFLLEFATCIYYIWGKPLSEKLSILDCSYAVLEFFSDSPNQNLDIFVPPCVLLWELGKFEDSQKYYSILYEAIKNNSGEKSEEYGFCSIAYAAAYYNADQLKESIPLYRKGLEILKEVSTENTFELARAYEKVARTYIYDENPNYEKSEELFNKAIEIRNKQIDKFKSGEKIKCIEVYEPYSLDRAEDENLGTIRELGRLYLAKEDFEKAYECSQKYVDGYSKLTRVNLPNLAYGYCDVAVSLMGLSKKLDDNSEEKNKMLNEAEELLKKAQKINEDMLGETSISTYETFALLGDLHTAKKQFSEATNYYLAVLNIVEKYFSHKTDYIEKIKNKMKFN